MSQRLGVGTADSFLAPETQEQILEYHAAILERRHISDTEQGKDTSYDVFQLAMAHADLTYWRSLQNKLCEAPREHETAIKTLVDVVGPISHCVILAADFEINSSPLRQFWRA